MWARKVTPDPEAQARIWLSCRCLKIHVECLTDDAKLQQAGDKITSTPHTEVDQSLASIRSHRSSKTEDQDDVPFAVKDWSPSWSDVATDGVTL